MGLPTREDYKSVRIDLQTWKEEGYFQGEGDNTMIVTKSQPMHAHTSSSRVESCRVEHTLTTKFKIDLKPVESTLIEVPIVWGLYHHHFHRIESNRIKSNLFQFNAIEWNGMESILFASMESLCTCIGRGTGRPGRRSFSTFL